MTPIIGRQQELALLHTQYKEAREGRANVVLITGEPGIGKTRLLKEFGVFAALDGVVVLRGGASEAEGMPPYLPFLEALGHYIQCAPPELLRDQVTNAPHILASILPELALCLGDTALPQPSPAEQARLRLYEAVGTFLAAIGSQNTLVLLLDDLHWADSASLDLLCHVMRRQSNAHLLIVGAYRSSESEQNAALARTIHELSRQRILTTITASPLTESQVEILARSYLNYAVSPTLTSLLYTQSEGNPFFVEELLHGWLETGVLAKEQDQWTAVALLERTLPPSIISALRQRFGRVAPEIIDHLRIAAIIGRTFDVTLLATIEGKDIELVEEHLLEAVRAHLVRIDPTGDFTFSHDKIRECLYTEVSNSRRRRLHGVIGSVLERRYVNEMKEREMTMHRLAELAFHFTQSGDQVRGVEYSQRAAMLALRAFAFEEAIAHYRTALELLKPDDARSEELLLALSEAMLQAGKEAEAKASGQGILSESAHWQLIQAEQELAQGSQAHILHAQQLLTDVLTQFKQLSITVSHSTVQEPSHAPVPQREPAAHTPLPADLTKREIIVLRFIACGWSNRQIAHELGLSEKTVANHITHIFNKVTCENRAAATAFAVRHGLA
ncbi:MAG: hypothetical protein NVS4B11_00360 [Ktedonobacteraceae bacterium]